MPKGALYTLIALGVVSVVGLASFVVVGTSLLSAANHSPIATGGQAPAQGNTSPSQGSTDAAAKQAAADAAAKKAAADAAAKQAADAAAKKAAADAAAGFNLAYFSDGMNCPINGYGNAVCYLHLGVTNSSSIDLVIGSHGVITANGEQFRDLGVACYAVVDSKIGDTADCNARVPPGTTVDIRTQYEVKRYPTINLQHITISPSGTTSDARLSFALTDSIPGQ
jgi:hypothetical protein